MTAMVSSAKRPAAVPCRVCPLRRLPIFKVNTTEEIDFIERMRIEQVDIPAGKIILSEGQIQPPLYSLFAGWAFRFKTLSDGRRQILNFLLPGDLIGFQAHMLGDAIHGVEALTDVRLCRHGRDKVWTLYQNYPELAFDVTWLTAQGEAVIDEALVAVGRRSALESIAMLLLHLFKRGRALNLTEGNSLALPLTQQHIGDALGLSLVHTNKTLRRLQKLGFLHFERQRFTLLDIRSLEKLADYFERPLLPRPLL